MSPSTTSGEEYTTDEYCFVAVNEASTLPSDVTTCTTLPACCADDSVIPTNDCVDPSDGVCAMPDAPTAISSPPETANVPLKSSAPLPSFVGPDTTTVPPLMVIEPFESSPSPSASTTSEPPVMFSSTPSSADMSPPPR